jgi:hypothetical protein
MQEHNPNIQGDSFNSSNSNQDQYVAPTLDMKIINQNENDQRYIQMRNSSSSMKYHRMGTEEIYNDRATSDFFL